MRINFTLWNIELIRKICYNEFVIGFNKDVMHMIKILSRLLIVMLISLVLVNAMIPSLSFAATTGTEQLDEAVDNLNTGSDETYAILKEIMGILAWVGFAVATFKVVQIGIMFMTGISSKRSGAKESIIPWLIGSLICAMFGVLGPWFINMFAEGDTGDIFSTIFMLLR